LDPRGAEFGGRDGTTKIQSIRSIHDENKGREKLNREGKKLNRITPHHPACAAATAARRAR
jgi:hypothetical protein